MRTLIAIPCMDHVPALFAQSLATLQKEGDVKIAFQMGSLIYTSRNNLAKKAIQMEADLVFWLDSDMTFAPDTLTKMTAELQEKNLDILTGIYFRRVPPYTPTLFDDLHIDENGRPVWSAFTMVPNELFEVGGCGFGCVLMRTEVFMTCLAKEPFLFDPFTGIGEDLSFCIRARQNGYKVFCDPNIKCGHVGNYVVTEDFFKTYSRSITEELTK